MVEWMDAGVRAILEAKRGEMRAQLEQLEQLLGDAPPPSAGPGRLSMAHDYAPAAPAVRAGRKPLTDEQKKVLSKRMKAVWKARKQGAGA